MERMGINGLYKRDHFVGFPPPTTAPPFRFRNAASIAACMLFSCFPVAAGDFPAKSALQISSAVMGLSARLSVSTTAL